MSHIKIKEIFFIIVSLYIFQFTLSYADYNRRDEEEHNENMNIYLDETREDSNCYKFILNNKTEKDILNWKIQFKIEGNGTIKSLWGGKYTQSGSELFIHGLDWNANLPKGSKDNEVGICLNGKNKIQNVDFGEDHDDNDENDDHNNEGTNLQCGQTEIIKNENLIKNGGFETYVENNMMERFWYSMFGGDSNNIPEWESENGNYILKSSSNITSSQEGVKFLEINDEDDVSQDIDTKEHQNYKFSFYNLGGDELEIKWNGKIIHKKHSSDTWNKNEYILEGINGKSKLEIINNCSKSDNNDEDKHDNNDEDKHDNNDEDKHDNNDEDKPCGNNNLGIGIDNIQLQEITHSNEYKINLMSLLNDTLINTVSNNSCSDIFYSLSDTIKNDLIQKLLTAQDYTTIASDFFNSIALSSKFEVVKNTTYEIVKNQITPCNTEEEKTLFYNAVYDQTIQNIETCVLNNLNTAVNKQLESINYLKASGATSCSMSGNTIKLNFLHNYSGYK